MRKSELERRLEIFLVGQRVDRFEISESAAGDLHVELTLKPDTPINETIHCSAGDGYWTQDRITFALPRSSQCFHCPFYSRAQLY